MRDSELLNFQLACKNQEKKCDPLLKSAFAICKIKQENKNTKTTFRTLDK